MFLLTFILKKKGEVFCACHVGLVRSEELAYQRYVVYTQACEKRQQHAGVTDSAEHKKGAPMGLETMFGMGAITSKLNKVINWGRKYSFFPFPFVTACCGMEFMATWGSHYDIARFGAEFPRFSPRQADLLMVVGTVNHKIAPVLKRVYDQMCEPKWVVAFGACASSGGFYRNYATVQGIDRVIPVDVYIAGCPPRPEAVLEGLMLLQKKVETEDVLDRSTPLLVDGHVYSESRLVHVTPPVNTRADHVVGAHEPQGVHQGLLPGMRLDGHRGHSGMYRHRVPTVSIAALPDA